MHFVFDHPTDHGRRRPQKHLADVEIVFDEADGDLSGLKLVGFAIWERGENGADGLTVTLPGRRVGRDGGGGTSGRDARDWFFDYLRSIDGDLEPIRRLKHRILTAYIASRVGTGAAAHA